MELRVRLAALMLAPFAVALGRMPEVRSRWRQFLVLGLLNAAVPFTLIAFAEIEITASLAAILNSTTVLFSALVAAAWIGDPLTGQKIFGVVLGTTGVTVLLGLDPLPLNGPILLAVGASLGAALSYAISGTHIRKAFAGVRPLTLAIGQQSGAALLLLLPAAATLPGEAPSLPVALSALALAVLCTAVAYLLFFTLIANVGPTSTLTVTFLAPGFGVLFGVLLLGEPVGLGILAGLAIILLSVALVTGISLEKGKEKRVQWRRDGTGLPGRPLEDCPPGSGAGLRCCGVSHPRRSSRSSVVKRRCG